MITGYKKCSKVEDALTTADKIAIRLSQVAIVVVLAYQTAVMLGVA